MAEPRDFQVHPEEDSDTARVECAYCHQQIGRIETVPESLHGEEAKKRGEEVEGELLTMSEEHLANCSAKSE